MNVRKKFVLLLIIISVIMGLAMVLAIRFRLKRYFSLQSKDKEEFIKRDLISNSVNFILAGDLYHSQTLIDTYIKINECIEYIYITDTKGKILAQTFREKYPVSVKNITSLNNLDALKLLKGRDDVYKFDIPIYEGKGGFLHLGISKKLENKLINNVIKEITEIIILIVLLVACFAYFLLNWIIIKPVSGLIMIAQAVGKGDMNSRVVIKTKDEIGKLGMAFNDMISSIQRITVSKDYFDNIIQTMTDMLIVIKPGLTIENINKAALDLLGYKEEELVGKSIRTIFTGLWQGNPLELKQLRELILRGEFRDHRITYKTRDGREFLLLLSSSVLRNPKGGITLIFPRKSGHKEELVLA